MTETIAMIHGMWGGPWVWENYKRYFEEKGYRCTALTLPFHDVAPESDPDPRLGKMSIRDYAEALEREIRQLETVPIVMGHSMGGLLAQILGSRGLAKALVLLTPAAPRGILSIRLSVLRSFWSVLTTWGFWRKPTRQTFGEAVYSMMHLMPADEQRKAYSRSVFESGKTVFEIGFWLLDTRKATHVDASTVECPVLVIAGVQDRITPASVVRKVAKKYETVSEYKPFPDHAHWVIGEPGWEDIAHYVEEWLNRQGL
jgi:pimeloyl-ACP methyl ester carboxylesterase